MKKMTAVTVMTALALMGLVGAARAGEQGDSFPESVSREKLDLATNITAQPHNLAGSIPGSAITPHSRVYRLGDITLRDDSWLGFFGKKNHIYEYFVETPGSPNVGGLFVIRTNPQRDPLTDMVHAVEYYEVTADCSSHQNDIKTWVVDDEGKTHKVEPGMMEFTQLIANQLHGVGLVLCEDQRAGKTEEGDWMNNPYKKRYERTLMLSYKIFNSDTLIVSDDKEDVLEHYFVDSSKQTASVGIAVFYKNPKLNPFTGVAHAIDIISGTVPSCDRREFATMGTTLDGNGEYYVFTKGDQKGNVINVESIAKDPAFTSRLDRAYRLVCQKDKSGGWKVSR